MVNGQSKPIRTFELTDAVIYESGNDYIEVVFTEPGTGFVYADLSFDYGALALLAKAEAELTGDRGQV